MCFSFITVSDFFRKTANKILSIILIQLRIKLLIYTYLNNVKYRVFHFFAKSL